MMPEWPLDQVYNSSSGDVRWQALGDQSHPPVVLLHGTPFSSYVWRGIARALSWDYRVYVWDMPGYGYSAKYTGQDVSLAAQGKVFTQLLEHWGLDHPAVIAHDFGGAVALRAHLLHGAGYRQLALVDPVALAPWGSPFFRLVGQNVEVFEQIPAAIHAAMVREYISSASHQGLRKSTMDVLVRPWLGEQGQPAFYRQIAQAHQRYTDEVQSSYHQLQLPLRVCWGAEDTWIPVAKGHELADMIPNAELVLLEGAGHLVQEDAPSELAAALLTFLRAQ